MACRAAASFSSCFSFIFITSCRNFSLASWESRPPYRLCLRASSSGQGAPGSQAGPGPSEGLMLPGGFWGRGRAGVWLTLLQAGRDEVKEGMDTGPVRQTERGIT